MSSLTRRSALGALGAPCFLRGASKKPNFLFLIADDHAGYALGADGDRLSSTPNLDHLASQSVRFTRHFLQLAGVHTVQAVAAHRSDASLCRGHSFANASGQVETDARTAIQEVRLHNRGFREDALPDEGRARPAWL